MIKASVLLSLTLVIVLFFLNVNTFAQTNPDGALIMSNKIQNPKTGEFVASLSPNDATLEPGREVIFRIEIKNSSSTDLSNIQMTGQFPHNPDLLNFVSGPQNGRFDAKEQIFSWTIGNLKKAETQTFDIQAQVKPVAQLPNKDIICTVGFVQAQKDQQIVQSKALFCLQPLALQLAGAVLPKTGFGLWTKEGLLLSASFLYLGMRLKRIHF